MADDRKSFVIKENELGGVKIADDVVAVIAGLAVTEIEGVASLAGNLTNEMIPKSSANKLAKGIKIATSDGNRICVRTAINLEYGYEIPTVCEQVQDRVKSTIENMTGLEVISVDIRIATVSVANQ